MVVFVQIINTLLRNTQGDDVSQNSDTNIWYAYDSTQIN